MPKGMDYKVSDSRLQDNTQASPVKKISGDAEKYDMGRVKEMKQDSKGYPKEAWNYKY